MNQPGNLLLHSRKRWMWVLAVAMMMGYISFSNFRYVPWMVANMLPQGENMDGVIVCPSTTSSSPSNNKNENNKNENNKNENNNDNNDNNNNNDSHNNKNDNDNADNDNENDTDIKNNNNNNSNNNNDSNAPPNANTGSLFSGAVVRTFSGKRRLYDDDNNDADADAVMTVEPSFSLPLHPNATLCPKWGVVTTIHPPTTSIRTFAALKDHDWCLVIVADTRTPTEEYVQLIQDHEEKEEEEGRRRRRIVFLSLQDQNDMANHSPFVKMIPFQSFARKNIGYLFAIRHGAQAIFDFDDDNVLKEAAFSSSPHNPNVLLHDGESSSSSSSQDRRWIVRTTTMAATHNQTATMPLAFNPLPFMKPSVSEIWPRGFPLQDIRKFQTTVTTTTTKTTRTKTTNTPPPPTTTTTTLQSIPRSKIAVIQATCDGDPDVDAIYRLTRPLPVTFDETPANAVRLLVPPGRYSPYNAQATTHFYDAFWGLLLPYTVMGRVTDIWRSYFTQRILHDLGMVVVYSPPLVVHDRSIHNYIADLQAEQDLYMKTEALLAFLSTWTDTSPKLPARIENLSIALYERDFIGLDDVLAMQEWLLALTDIGFKFPSLKGVQESSLVMKKVSVLHQQAFMVPSVYNLGGEEGDWKLYREYIAPEESSIPVTEWNATIEDWNEWLEGSKKFQKLNPALVPSGIVLSLVLMAKDEWPILRNTVLYHGHLLGFENLYILDSSTDPRCTSFLVYARDQLGLNVIFTPATLNDLEYEMTLIGLHLAGSSDLIMKIDADEFVAVETNDGTSCQDNSVGRSPRNCPISPLAMKAFLQNRTNLVVFFSGVGRLFIGSASGSVPDRELCRAGQGDEVASYMYTHNPKSLFKAIVDARTLEWIDLGGHVNFQIEPHGASDAIFLTPVSVFHAHARCFQHEVDNCRKALVSHGYLAESDSPQKSLRKLKKFLGESSCAVDSTTKMTFQGASSHKVLFYARYLLGCEGATEEAFYPSSYGSATSNPDFKFFMDEALSLYQ